MKTRTEQKKRRRNAQLERLHPSELNQLQHQLHKIDDLARFPGEDPNPILRISSGGELLYANAASESLLEEFGYDIENKVSTNWCKTISRIFGRKMQEIIEIIHNEKIYSFTITPVIEGGYVNLYGHDITEQKKAEEVLRKTYDELETRVGQRTRELSGAVKLLKEQVVERTQAEKALEAGKEQLKAANQQLQASEENLRQSNYNLGERIKELKCLYGLSQLGEQGDIALEEIFQELAELIPPGWQYPKITVARITFEGRQFKTSNFQKTCWIQSADIKVHGQKVGSIDVCYLKKMPVIDEGPFLKEERSLLNALVEHMGSIIERKQTEKALRESEEKYRSLTESMAEAIFVNNRQGRYRYVNDVAANIFGKSAEEIIGKEFSDFFKPEEAKRMLGTVEAVFRDKTPVHLEYTLTLDGEPRHFSATLSPIHDENGDITSVVGVSQDITDRKRTEQQKTLNMRILDVINQSVGWKEGIKGVLNEIKNFTGFEAVAICFREGEDFPYYATEGFLASFVETERYLCVRDGKGEIERDSDGNPYLECMCGNIVCGRTDPSKDFFTEGGSFWCNNTSKLLAETAEKDRQTRTRNRCNSEGYESVALIPLKAGHKILGLIQLNDRRTDRFTKDLIYFFEELGENIGIAFARKQTEEALHESEEKYRSFVQNFRGIAYRGNMNWQPVFFHGDVEEITGYKSEDFVSGNPTWDKVIHPDDIERIENNKIRTMPNYSTQREYRIIRKDGEIRWVSERIQNICDETGKPVMVQGAIFDITERKKMEDSLRESEKLAAKGQLAAKIAHEINNPLAGIKNSFMLIKDSIRQDHPYYRYVELIDKEIDRVSNVVRQMFGLYKNNQESDFSVNDTVWGVAAMLEVNCCKSDISLKFNACKDPKTINIGESSLREVLYNIIENAIEASPAGSKIRMSTTTTKRGMVIAIRDEGEGIKPELLGHIFESSFTTKKDRVGSGLGLGLSISKNLIETAGGNIEVESKWGKGTVFNIIIPFKRENEKEVTND